MTPIYWTGGAKKFVVRRVTHLAELYWNGERDAREGRLEFDTWEEAEAARKTAAAKVFHAEWEVREVEV